MISLIIALVIVFFIINVFNNIIYDNSNIIEDLRSKFIARTYILEQDSKFIIQQRIRFTTCYFTYSSSRFTTQEEAEQYIKSYKKLKPKRYEVK